MAANFPRRLLSNLIRNMVSARTISIVYFSSLVSILSARDFVVLSEYDRRRWISDVSFGVSYSPQNSPSSTATGCQGDRLILLCLPRSVYLDRLSENVTLSLQFQVHGLIMGPNAGRAYVFVDEIRIASCVFESCAVIVPLGDYSQCMERDSAESKCSFAHDVSIRLFATEATLQYEEIFFLGEEYGIPILVAPRAEGGSDTFLTLHDDERVPAHLCKGGDVEEMHAGLAERAEAQDLSDESAEEPERVAEEGESSEAQHDFMRHLIQSHAHIREVLQS